MRFRPTVPPTRVSRLPRSSGACRRRATLLAVAVCAILAKGHLLEAKTSSHNAAVAQNAGTAPVTIVAPEFCKDQTWPYIDSRCLRAHRQPGAGRTSSDRRAGRDRSDNACAQRGKREHRRRHTANRCDDCSSDERSSTDCGSVDKSNERATGGSGVEPDGHARPGHAICVSSLRTGHQNLPRHQRLHARH